MSNNSPPLSGIRVLEFAGLAPGPFAGLILADFGAAVLRVDRPHETAHTNRLPSPTADFLVRHKSSICVDIKHNSGVTFLKSLLPHVDVVIDPFRPGVLERLGLGPRDVMTQINPRLIVARMTGFRRDGKYKDMAGHDINYIAVSGVLSMLGRKGEAPYAPGNIIGDFAGGGAVCAMGVMLALISRNNTGRGQIVEANMVDGSAYLATMPRLSMKLPMWDDERGKNLLDGGAPYYGTYETKDKKFMSIGALEPHFFAELLRGLSLSESALPGRRDDKTKWPAMRALFATRFLTKTRDEWERIFDGTDACVTPVLSQAELEAQGFDHRPIVTLDETPAFAIANSHEAKRPSAEGQGSGVEGEGWIPTGLAPSQGGEEVLQAWTGWEKDRDFRVKAGALASIETKPKL